MGWSVLFTFFFFLAKCEPGHVQNARRWSGLAPSIFTSLVTENSQESPPKTLTNKTFQRLIELTTKSEDGDAVISPSNSRLAATSQHC